jgi:hypothetical protein
METPACPLVTTLTGTLSCFLNSAHNLSEHLKKGGPQYTGSAIFLIKISKGKIEIANPQSLEPSLKKMEQYERKGSPNRFHWNGK